MWDAEPDDTRPSSPFSSTTAVFDAQFLRDVASDDNLNGVSPTTNAVSLRSTLRVFISSINSGKPGAQIKLKKHCYIEMLFLCFAVHFY